MPPSRAAMRPTPEVSNRALGTADAAVSRSPTTRGSAVSAAGGPAWMSGGVVGAALRTRADAGAFVAAGASTGRGTSGNAAASGTVGVSTGTATSAPAKAAVTAGTSTGAVTSGEAGASVTTGSVTSGKTGSVTSGDAGASGT